MARGLYPIYKTDAWGHRSATGFFPSRLPAMNTTPESYNEGQSSKFEYDLISFNQILQAILSIYYQTFYYIIEFSFMYNREFFCNPLITSYQFLFIP